MKLAALAAAALLAPTFATAPPRPPQEVSVVVAHPTGPPDVATGFVAGDGRVVTVAHVLGEDVAGDHVMAGPASAIAVDGRPAMIVRLDRRLDLAVLRVPGVHGDAPRVGGGDDVTLLGRPAHIVRRIDASVDDGPRRRRSRCVPTWRWGTPARRSSRPPAGSPASSSPARARAPRPPMPSTRPRSPRCSMYPAASAPTRPSRLPARPVSSR